MGCIVVIAQDLYDRVRMLCMPICYREAKRNSIDPVALTDDIANRILFRLVLRHPKFLDRFVRKSARLNAIKFCSKTRLQRRRETKMSDFDEKRSSTCRSQHRESVVDEVARQEQIRLFADVQSNSNYKCRRKQPRCSG